MDLVVARHGYLTGDRMHDAARHSAPGQRVVDLRNLKFVDSAGIVLIAATAYRASSDGAELIYYPPDPSADCSRYLFRMGLEHELRSLGVESGLTRVGRHQVGDRLMELRPFVAEDRSVDELAEQVFRIVRRAAIGRDAARALVTGITEIGSNVAEHSCSQRGYVALQQYDVGRRGHRVSFCIGDTGIGLRASLSASHSVIDDRQAVALAIEEGVSGTGSVGRGNGVSDVLRSTSDGSLLLWSGAGRGYFRNGNVLADGIHGGARHVSR